MLAVKDLLLSLDLSASKKSVPYDKIENKSFNEQYFKLKNIRRSARVNEKDNNLTPSKKTNTDWNLLAAETKKMLINTHHNLELLCWHVEAIIRTDGIDGLKQGFLLINEYIKQIPEINKTDYEINQNPLQGFINFNGEDSEGTLKQALFYMPLKLSEHQILPFWKINDIIKSNNEQGIKKLKQNIIDNTHIVNALQKTNNTILIYQLICEDIQQKPCYSDIPTSNIKNGLTETRDIIIQLASKTDQKLAPTTIEVLEKPNLDTNKQSNNVIINEKVSSIELTRHGALKSISTLAQFFRDTEPHSPIPYLLERAVKWGGMSLPDLLSEMITDDSVRVSVCKLTGIEQQQETQHEH
jgi:type VI secretion system protein ImpA